MASKTKAVQPPAEQPAAKVAKASKKKAGAAAPWFAADVSRIKETLQVPVAELPNKEVRSMLLEGLPFAVKSASDFSETGTAAAEAASEKPVRHAFQEEILALVRKALSADEVAATSACKAALEEVNQAADILEGLKKEAKEAEAAVQRAEAAIQEAEEQVRAASSESGEAEVGHAEAKHATKPAREAKLKAEALKSTVGEIAGDFEVLANAAQVTEEDAQRAAKANRVGGFLEDTKAEKCLVVAANVALPRAAAERGRFDRHAVDSVGKVIDAKLREAEERLAAAAPAVEIAEAFELGMSCVLDLAREQEATCSKTLAAGKSLAKTTKQKEADAQSCVQAQEGEVEKLRSQQAAAEEKLQAVEAALAGLERLDAGTPAPAPVEEPAPMLQSPAVPDSPATKSPAHSERKAAAVATSPGSASKMVSPAKRKMTGSPATATRKRCVATPTRTNSA
eukprot:TRINITY_DN16095_c0_g1_i1.p1 TRINITY_DN16095_c0_g1~~TRINITY_DN16095_c0_g1_i1.p1  ORF type:complete len:479 (-),score=177.19 TRINITY_DN16095_c0_g1_i1:252-1613(-)